VSVKLTNKLTIKSGKVGLLYREPTQAVYARTAINKESYCSIEQY
jgi:hypothetical protein